MPSTSAFSSAGTANRYKISVRFFESRKQSRNFIKLFTNPNPNIVKIHIDIVCEHIDKHIQSIYTRKRLKTRLNSANCDHQMENKQTDWKLKLVNVLRGVLGKAQRRGAGGSVGGLAKTN